MRAILIGIIMVAALTAGAQVTSISPNQAYRGDSLYTTITSSSLFLTGSSPQGNIQNIILKNASDSVFALSDSTNVVNASTATTFWKIPGTIAAGLYSLVVRVYNSLFTGPTTDYTLSNAFNITTPVWPGDADNNQVVDNNDLLPIGLGYGTLSNARLANSIVWQAQSSINWPFYFTNYQASLNYKYADCNGDGIINAADTMAIIQNFSLIHSKNNSGPGTWRSGLPGLVPLFDRQVLYNGDSLVVWFVLGDSNTLAQHIYGIAFTYNYDPLVTDSGFTRVKFVNSWFADSLNSIHIAKNIGGQGQIKIALTRINHTTSNGSGGIGYCTFKITTDNISGSFEGPQYNYEGFISDITVIDSSGNNILVNAGADSALLYVYPASINTQPVSHIQIMPNPAEDKVLILAGQVINEITITDINGKRVWQNTALYTKKVNIDISAYADGLYFVQVKTAGGESIEKLLITK